MADWKVFRGVGNPHNDLNRLPPPPPWRFAGHATKLRRPRRLAIEAEKSRALPFIPGPRMVLAVNAALYLRRPLLLTGMPGTGKSTLISKVAYELKLGPVIRWSIASRSTVRGGIYDYDAVGRLQASRTKTPPVQEFLKLGPLGTALIAETWPRPLLIDEIDKSDLDFANDLLNVIEEGTYEIPELRRLNTPSGRRTSYRRPAPRDQQLATVNDYFGVPTVVRGGTIRCGQFPFIVMTSNAEREFSAPFLRRCVRLKINQPTPPELENILDAHLGHYATMQDSLTIKKRDQLVADFDKRRRENQDLATDQLLNAVFLTVTLKDGERSFSDDELRDLRDDLLRPIGGTAT